MLIGLFSNNIFWQALVSELRTIWDKVSQFDVDMIRKFLKPNHQPAIQAFPLQ